MMLPYPQYFEEIQQAVLAVQEDRADRAKQLLAEVETRLPGETFDPEIIHTRFFIDGLRKRLLEETWEIPNLYLLPDQGRQIQLFNFMGKRFPLVYLAHQLSGQLLRSAIQGLDAVTLLDIGIGTAQQELTLLGALAQEGRLPKKMTIIGIEPTAGSLQQASSRLLQFADEHGMVLEFVPIPKTLETISAEEWANIRSLSTAENSPLVIYAGFSLHHIRPAELRIPIAGEAETTAA